MFYLEETSIYDKQSVKKRTDSVPSQRNQTPILGSIKILVDSVFGSPTVCKNI